MRNDRPTDAGWASSLQPGWQRRRNENFTNLTSGVFDTEDLVSDGWTEIIANLNFGDADGKTLYMTARTGLYRLRVNVTGAR